MDIVLKEKKIVADNTIELVFEKPEGFTYAAGQYAFLDVYDQAGEPLMRPMSFSSHPTDEYLRFTMRMSDSPFKQAVARMSAGDKASILGPKGFFTVNIPEKPIVFLVGGIGITPVMSMLRELEAQQFAHTVYLVYSNKKEDDVAYIDDLEKIGIKDLRMILKFTQGGSRINGEKLATELGDLTQYQYYVVGGNSFVESMKEIIRDAGVTMDNIAIDNFGI